MWCIAYSTGPSQLGDVHGSSQAHLEWKAKFEQAIWLRKVVQESNKVFEVETLNVDTFPAPTLMANVDPSWNNDENFFGKVTCSVPFSR